MDLCRLLLLDHVAIAPVYGKYPCAERAISALIANVTDIEFRTAS